MNSHVIVIGAGLAGLAAARGLKAAGRAVTVLEKSRGLGGRAATRRWDGLPVDHGAQFFTVRSDAFRAQAEDWLARGVCHEWTRALPQYREGKLHAATETGHPRYVCRAGMSALGRDLAAGFDEAILRQAKAVSIACEDGTWAVGCEDGRILHARALVVTAPAPQAAALLRSAAPEVAGWLDGIRMAPCLAVAARYARRGFPWTGIQSDDDAVSWIAHDTSKRPESHGGKSVIVVHASAGFSESRYEAPESEVTAGLLESASRITGEDLRAPEAAFLQRWRYALPVQSAPADPCVFFATPAPLVLAGDGIAGGKIEGAWLSGIAAAEAIS